MDYNLEGMAPLPQPNALQRLWKLISSAGYGRTIAVIAVLLIAAAVPLTTYISQQEQDIRQKAATSGEAELINPQNNLPFSSGQTITNPEITLRIRLPDSWTSPLVKINKENAIASNFSPVKKAYAQAATTCTSLSFSPAQTAIGDTVDVVARYSGTTPSLIEIWAKGPDNTERKLATDSVSGGGTKSMLVPITASLPTGSHTGFVKLGDAAGDLINTPYDCTTAFTITGSAPTPTPVCTDAGWDPNNCSSRQSPGHCSDYGQTNYCGWTQAQYDACRQRCASPTNPPGGKTLQQFIIENIDSGTGGSPTFTADRGHPEFAQRYNEAINGQFYWKLNTNPGQKQVKVTFIAADGASISTQSQTVTLSGGIPPTIPPPGTTGACRELRPSETVPPSMGIPDTTYRWKPAPSCSAASCYNGENPATYHDKCAQYKNTSQPGFVNPDTSYWCYGFQGPSGERDSSYFRCLTLTYIGSTTGPSVTPPPGVPSPTAVPTSPPGGPTSTPILTGPTATPVPGGTSFVTISTVLSGIGPRLPDGTPQKNSNQNPKRTTRDLTIHLYDPADDPTNDKDGTRAKFVVTRPNALVFDGTSKFVATDFNLGDTFVPGDYQVFVKTKGFLRKRIPGIKKLQAGKNTITPAVTLTVGDVNADNFIDINDYNHYISCFPDKQTQECIASVDFNDDGLVDTTINLKDYALLLTSFTVHEGD